MPDRNAPQGTGFTADTRNDNRPSGRPTVEGIEKHGDDLDALCAMWSSPLAVVWCDTSADDDGGASICIQTRLRDGTEAMPIYLKPAGIGDAWMALENKGGCAVIARRASLASLIAALNELPAWHGGEAEDCPTAA